jgi:hypothetical protein
MVRRDQASAPLPGTPASLHPPMPGHPHFDNLLSIGDVQASRSIPPGEAAARSEAWCLS